MLVNNAAGVETLLAGAEERCGCVDGPAGEASFADIVDVVINQHDGSMFVVDNCRVCKVLPEGQ